MRILLIATVIGNFFESNTHTLRQKGYTPPSTFVTNINESGGQMTLEQSNDFTTTFLSKKLGIQKQNLKITNSYCQGDLCHFYFIHSINDIIVSNHPASVNMFKGNIITYSHSFNQHFDIVCDESILSVEQAISRAEKELGLKRNEKEIQIVYYDTGKGLVLGYSMQLEGNGDMVGVVVSQCTGELVNIHSYVSNL